MPKKKLLEEFGGQLHPNTCSSSSNPHHNKCKPSLMLGKPILLDREKFWHLFVEFELRECPSGNILQWEHTLKSPTENLIEL